LQTCNSSQINSEANAASNLESFRNPSNSNFDCNGDSDWNTVAELSSGVNNMSFSNKFTQHVESASCKDNQLPSHSGNDWGSQMAAGSKSVNIESTPDNLPILESKNVSYI
jgi:hypothetical protein